MLSKALRAWDTLLLFHAHVSIDGPRASMIEGYYYPLLHFSSGAKNCRFWRQKTSSPGLQPRIKLMYARCTCLGDVMMLACEQFAQNLNPPCRTNGLLISLALVSQCTKRSSGLFFRLV